MNINIEEIESIKSINKFESRETKEWRWWAVWGFGMKGHEFNFGHAKLEAPLKYLSRNMKALNA